MGIILYIMRIIIIISIIVDEFAMLAPDRTDNVDLSARVRVTKLSHLLRGPGESGTIM